MILPPPRMSWFQVYNYAQEHGFDLDIPTMLRDNWRLTARREQLPPGPTIIDNVPHNWHIWLLMAGRGFGKALALDTLVPTPSGYSTMGNLRAGDEIFDEFGEICQVQKAHEVLFNRKCYKVSFSDGTTVVADADHLWKTRCDRMQSAKVINTQEIKDSIQENHSIDCFYPRHFSHRIVEISEAPSVPVRCITVDSPSSLYLITKSMIPTHNTRVGAEWVHEQKRAGIGRIAIVAPTAADARDVLVEGESGILATAPKHDRPIYEPTKRRISWPNGAMATLFSADEPDRMRGPQHGAAWCDELAAWRYMQEAWDMLMLGLRLGTNPQVVATTTPRPLKLLKALMIRSREGYSVKITRGSTYDNISNLAPTMAEEILSMYEGTRLGRQEIWGELLEDFDGALWSQEMIDKAYIRNLKEKCDRVVIAIDPSTSAGENADDTGIIAAGKIKKTGYILEDGSLKGSPAEWAGKAIRMYYKHEADTIIAEKNQGGDMITHTIHSIDDSVPVKLVHASKAKITRAEPVAAQYEKEAVKHVGHFSVLEDEMTSFVPGEPSPGHFDAMVWAITELLIGKKGRIRAFGRG